MTNSLSNVVFSLLPGLVISLLSLFWLVPVDSEFCWISFFFSLLGWESGRIGRWVQQRKENSACFLYWVRQRSSLDIATSSQQTVFVDVEGGLFAVFSFY